MCKIHAKALTKDEQLIDATIKGFKPACLIGNCTGQPVKMNVPANCDIVSLQRNLKSGVTVYNDYILNINKVSEIIKNNYKLFIKRLGLSPESSVETIYNTMKEILGKMLGGSMKFPDLEGILLGFPKQNSMIYALEKFAGLGSEQRNNPLFKEKLLEAMQKEDSPYANMDKEECEALEQAIQNINKIQEFNNPLYYFIQYVKEPAEIKRIQQSAAGYEKSANSRLHLR